MNLKEKNNLFLKFDLETILKLKNQKKITEKDILDETISKTANFQNKFFFWSDFDESLKAKIKSINLKKKIFFTKYSLWS